MQPNKQHKRKYAAGIGGLFILLAVVGAIAVIIAGIRLTGQLLDNQRQKTTYEEILTPVVMFDPVPFEKPEDIDMQRLLLFGMWTTLSNEKSLTYTRNKEQDLLVPASDVEVSVRKLFGDSVTLTHGTFSDNETSYFFDTETNTYHVSTYQFLYTYKPSVLQIKKVDGLLEVLVSYTPPDNAWRSVFVGGGSQFPDKVMLFVMESVDSNLYLRAVKDPPSEYLLLPGVPQNDPPTNLGESVDSKDKTEEELLAAQSEAEKEAALEAAIPKIPMLVTAAIETVVKEEYSEDILSSMTASVTNALTAAIQKGTYNESDLSTLAEETTAAYIEEMENPSNGDESSSASSTTVSSSTSTTSSSTSAPPASSTSSQSSSLSSRPSGQTPGQTSTASSQTSTPASQPASSAPEVRGTQNNPPETTPTTPDPTSQASGTSTAPPSSSAPSSTSSTAPSAPSSETSRRTATGTGGQVLDQ